MLIGVITCLSSHINSRWSSVSPAPKRKVHPQRARYPAEDPRLTTGTVPTACQLTARHFPSRLFLLQWKVYGQLNLTPHMKFQRPQKLQEFNMKGLFSSRVISRRSLRTVFTEEKEKGWMIQKHVCSESLSRVCEMLVTEPTALHTYP